MVISKIFSVVCRHRRGINLLLGFSVVVITLNIIHLLGNMQYRGVIQSKIGSSDRISKATGHNAPLSRMSKEYAIVPRPGLNDMVNTSQKIITLTAPYRMENAELCWSVQDLFLLIIVHSACQNFDTRLFMRRTWANASYYTSVGKIRLLFLLGISNDTDFVTQNKVRSEFEENHDLLVGDFKDDYHNLTLKGVMAYKWITERCRSAKFILKIDDDVVIDLFHLFREIKQKYMFLRRHLICNYILPHSMPIIRNKLSKWFVDTRHFKKFQLYPTAYCSGFFVLMTNDLIPLLFRSSKITPFFWVDDVYLYGLVPGNVPGVQYVNPNGYWHSFDSGEVLGCYRNISRPCPFIAANVNGRLYSEELWFEILKRHYYYGDIGQTNVN